MHGPVFLVPVTAVLAVGSIGSGAADAVTAVTGADLVAAAVPTFLAGTAWQVLQRRDLVDRLTHLACVYVVVATGFFVVAWNAPVELGSPGVLTGVGSVVSGLVLTEQALRHHERRQGVEPRPEVLERRPV